MLGLKNISELSTDDLCLELNKIRRYVDTTDCMFADTKEKEINEVLSEAIRRLVENRPKSECLRNLKEKGYKEICIK